MTRRPHRSIHRSTEHNYRCQSAGWLPHLKSAHLDRQAGSPREVGHPRIGLDAEHGATGRLELACGDTSTAADVEHLEARLPAMIRAMTDRGRPSR